MDKQEFDKFADEYQAVHAQNIAMSGETTEFFAEYKIAELGKFAASIGLPAAGEVLDFGAGVGNSVPYFNKHLGAYALTCLDVSERSLDIARQRFPGQAEYIHFDGGRLPFDDKRFDIVFSACVCHHIQHARHPALLAEFYRVLKPGGLLLIFEHNPYNPLTVHAVNTCPFDDNADLIKAGTFRRRLQEENFSRTEVNYRIFVPGPMRFLRPLERFVNWLPLGAQYFVAGRK